MRFGIIRVTTREVINKIFILFAMIIFSEILQALLYGVLVVDSCRLIIINKKLDASSMNYNLEPNFLQYIIMV
jgi:hypothetical protein